MMNPNSFFSDKKESESLSPIESDSSQKVNNNLDHLLDNDNNNPLLILKTANSFPVEFNNSQKIEPNENPLLDNNNTPLIADEWSFKKAYAKQNNGITEEINDLSASLESKNLNLIEIESSENKLKDQIDDLNLTITKLTANLNQTNHDADLVLVATVRGTIRYTDMHSLEEKKHDLHNYRAKKIELDKKYKQLTIEKRKLAAEIKTAQQQINDLNLCLTFQKNIYALDFQAFEEVLKRLKLKAILLANLKLKPKYIEHIITLIILHGKHITHLNLQNSKICSGKDKSLLKKITELLENNKSLLSLNLSYNGIDDDDLKKIGKSLTDHPTLKVLDVSDNLITEKGILEFSRIIAPNRNLQLIKFDNNWIHMDANNQLLEISRNLTTNNPDRKLTLSQNFIAYSKRKSKEFRELFSQGIFRAAPSINPSCIDSSKSISCNKWIMFLMVKKTILDDHALMLVEGMHNGHLFIARFELFVNAKTGKGGISSKDMDPKTIDELLVKYNFKSWSVDKKVAKDLINNIKKQEDKEIDYSMLGMIRFGLGHNCFTWAVEQLEKVEIKDEDVAVGLLNIPSYKINSVTPSLSSGAFS